MTYFSKECTGSSVSLSDGSEAIHRKVGCPPLMIVESKILSLKTERNRLRAMSELFAICGLLSPSVESPSGGRRKNQF